MKKPLRTLALILLISPLSFACFCDGDSNDEACELETYTPSCDANGNLKTCNDYNDCGFGPCTPVRVTEIECGESCTVGNSTFTCDGVTYTKVSEDKAPNYNYEGLLPNYVASCDLSTFKPSCSTADPNKGYTCQKCDENNGNCQILSTECEACQADGDTYSCLLQNTRASFDKAGKRIETPTQDMSGDMNDSDMSASDMIESDMSDDM